MTNLVGQYIGRYHLDFGQIMMNSRLIPAGKTG